MGPLLCVMARAVGVCAGAAVQGHAAGVGGLAWLALPVLVASSLVAGGSPWPSGGAVAAAPLDGSALVAELLVGGALGLVLGLPTLALGVAGRAAGRGLGRAQPREGAAGPRALEQVLVLLGAGLFLSAGGAGPVVAGWMDLQAALPPGDALRHLPDAVEAATLVRAFGEWIAAGLLLALPLLGAAAASGGLAGAIQRWTSAAPQEPALAAAGTLAAAALWIALGLPGAEPLFASALQGARWLADALGG